jgi:hypothetical protein
MTKRLFGASLVLGAVVLVPSRGFADPITFIASSSSTDARSASVTFDTSSDGSTLVITLTNTSLTAPTTARDILTGLFFDIAGNPLLKPVDAVCLGYGQPGGCAITNGGTDAGSTLPGEVSGQWSFRDKTDLAYGADYGISSTFLGGLFNNIAFGFPGNVIEGRGSIDYGITTANDPCVDPTNAGCGVGVNNNLLWRPEISDSVVFYLSGLAPGFDPSATISNVTFNSGTGMSALPEPPTFALLGFGFLAVALTDRFRNKLLTQPGKQA